MFGAGCADGDHSHVGDSADAVAPHADVQVHRGVVGQELHQRLHSNRHGFGRADDCNGADRALLGAPAGDGAGPEGGTSTLVPEANTSTPVSRLLARAQDAPAEGRSVFRRLSRRGHDAGRRIFVGLVRDRLSFAGAPPDVALFLLAIVVVSGAAVGTQITATIAFVVGMLAVVEVVLVSYSAAPAKTEAIVQRLHDWACGSSSKDPGGHGRTGRHDADRQGFEQHLTCR